MWKLQPPSKSWGPVKAPIFGNLVGGSTPCRKGGGGGAHYASILLSQKANT